MRVEDNLIQIVSDKIFGGGLKLKSIAELNKGWFT